MLYHNQQPFQYQDLDKRVAKTGTAFIALVVIIIIRLVQLQVIHYHEMATKGERNFVRFSTIKAGRGTIYDCRSRPLAVTKEIVDIYWRGTGNKKLSKSQTELTNFLASNCHENRPSKEQLLQSIRMIERGFGKTKLISNVGVKGLGRIVEKYPGHPNIEIERRHMRYYPYGEAAAHIVGYISRLNTDERGLVGLEKLFDEHLIGNNGQTITIHSATGEQITSFNKEPAKPGAPIHTTLDIEIQNIAEKTFPEAHNGAMVVFDPTSGAIKTLLSRPSFDPNKFLSGISQEAWKKLSTESALLNRAMKAMYPPASIFKLVTLTAALELGIITTATTWRCPGYYKFRNRKYSCNNPYGHGSIDAMQAIKESCNIPFFDIGRVISIDALKHYATLFGLGANTESMLSESSGLIPSKEWKLKRFGEPWYPGETLSASVGQSFLLVTPLQIARMISAIFTGELLSPRIIEEEPIRARPLPISQSAREFLITAMKEVVEGGTGRRVANIRNLEVHAKTGTGQTSSLKWRKLGKKYLEHAWFVAHFAYKDEDPLFVVTIAENTGSSRTAAISTRNFLIGYRNLMEVRNKAKK